VRRLPGALAALTARERDVVLLIVWRLGRPDLRGDGGGARRAVRSRLNRARRRLRAALGAVDATALLRAAVVDRIGQLPS
jgi:RNA polymerase sigma-70 factor (ECF subfamily)